MKGMSSFGVWLKTALAEKGIQQKELADVIGVTETSISRYIHGERIPLGKKTQKIMDFFNCHFVIVPNDEPVFINQATQAAGRSITLGQLLYYFTEGEFIQICTGHDGWDEFIEFPATSKLLDPFKDRRIICMGAEELEGAAVIRVEIAEDGK